MEFIEHINSTLTAQIENIDQIKISHEDFKDIFVNTLNDVLKNRSKEKRTALTNILLNTVTNYNLSFDESEYISNLINSFTVKHLFILNEVSHYTVEKHKEEENAVVIIKSIIEKYSLHESDVLEHIRDLENEYLVSNLAVNYNMGKHPGNGGMSYSGMNSYITNKGKRVLNVITT